jgi:hypothetical protein
MSHKPKIKQAMVSGFADITKGQRTSPRELALFLSGAACSANWIGQLESFGAGHPQTVVASLDELAAELGLMRKE